jgi:hypothetical protein
MVFNFWTVALGSYAANSETTLSYASIMGMKTDANVSGGQYSWLGSMFYFGIFSLVTPHAIRLSCF